MIGRRGFIGGLVGFFAAPAIVRVEALMPVRAVPALIPGETWIMTNSLIAVQMITYESIRVMFETNAFIRNASLQHEGALRRESQAHALRLA